MMEERVAQVAADIWDKEISPQTAHILKRNLIDSYAGLCGALLDNRLIATLGRMVRLVPDEKGITVWGVGHRAQALQAVFMNTILGRRIDLVNTYFSPSNMGINHPSDNVSLLLTLADWKKLTGRDFLQAMQAAYTLSCAFSDYYDPEPAGYDHDAAAAFYVSLTSGLVEGLDVTGLIEAQRIAGVMGLNPDQTGVGLVTDWKHCTYASCAQRGVQAVLMAKAGFKGPVDIYEGQAGWNRFLPHADSFMASPPDLSTVVFKSWPALVFCQTAIDVAAELSSRFLDQDWKNVERIKVETYKKAVEEAGGETSNKPDSRAGRTHSLPYCVAEALLKGGVEYHSFGDQRAMDPELVEVMGKVEVIADRQMTAAFPAQAPCRLTVEYQNRQPLSAFQERPHGDPQDPLSDQEIGAKVLKYLTGLAGLEQAEGILARLWHLEEEDDLVWLLTPLRQGMSNT